VFYVHADHLGTPRVITRPSDNKVVWKWDSAEAFGNSLPNENPSALGAFKYNLRMPGQYFDQETGTFYNYFRDYDPQLGRYVQSDPIGLRGGMSTFGYVMGDPLAKRDPFGLAPGGVQSLVEKPKRPTYCYEKIRKEAFNEVGSVMAWGSGDDNTAYNAVGHCYGVCRLQKECGNAQRIVVAWGHEILSPNADGSGIHVPIIKYPDGTRNDIKNNAEGVGCAEGQPCGVDIKKDCMTCCMQKFMAGSLSYSK
jgi:RHS repeat-associated protein